MGFTFQQIHFNSGTKSFQADINITTLRGSPFKLFATRTTYPLLKLKRSIFLIMYSMYNAFCCHINGLCSLTLVLFGCNWVRILLLGPCPRIISTVRAMLHLVGNVQCIRCLLLLYLWLIKSSSVVTGDVFHYLGRTYL